jgi:RNA polymerase sigma factor (sigma-70 family)
MAALVKDSGRKTPARLAGSAILACQSDERLVSLVRSGHERAFDTIVDRYRRPLLRYCRSILPESRAEDAVQQTFINAHASLTEADDAVRLKPWLFAIARNASLNMLRQNGWNYEQIPLDFDGVRRPDQILEQRTQLEQTVSALHDLPERQRSALVMREFEGRSYEEIALALGANDGAVRQLLNRARGALRAAATAVLPPPLVARIAFAPPPEGRAAAEALGGLGAVGVAKAGATALIAGSLVVGAVKAPLPLGSHDKPTRQKATLSPGPAPVKDVSIAAKSPATPVVATTSPAAHARNHQAVTHRPASDRGGHQPAAARGGEDSGGHHSGSVRDDGEGRSGSSERSGSGDDSHSGSSGSGSDDTRTSRGREETSRSGASDDSATSGPGGATSGGSDDRTSTEPSSGSDDGLSSGSGSDPVTVDGSSSSGSGSSGSGSGASEPAPAVGTTGDH